jgi:hypothetical protein
MGMFKPQEPSAACPLLTKTRTWTTMRRMRRSWMKATQARKMQTRGAVGG